MYEIFDDLLIQCNITKNDKILVSSNILKLLIYFKDNKKKIQLSRFIKILKKKVGKNGTIMFPTFNWDFCKGFDFIYHETSSKTGSLSNCALKETSFKRTSNPIYSFAVSGKDRDYICGLEHKSCFGLNSPFGYLIENEGKCLFIGMDYKEGFTFVHVAEEAVGVNFRYFKEFSGNYINEDNKKIYSKYKMYVRKENSKYVTGINERLDDVLIKKNAYKKVVFEGIKIGVLDIKRTYEIMINDLRGKTGLIYPKKILNR
jgi:aminoglycoside 3-N-acetyltransferase